MDYHTIIQNIIQNNKLHTLNNLNEVCNDDNKQKIKDLINYFNNDNDNTIIQQTDIQQRLNKIDNIIYKKPWNKLNIKQKEIKLNEYIDNFIITNNNFIKNKIIEEFKNNKLNSSKDVIYDPIKCIITDIKKLSFDTNKQIYIYK